MHNIAGKKHMAGGKVGNAVFLLLFFGLVLVPVIFLDWKSGACQVERRQLALEPSLIIDGHFNNDYFRSFEAWLADRVGFRLPFIFLYQNIHLKIYGQFNHPLGIFGAEKELYYVEDLRQMVRDDAAIDFLATNMEQGIIARMRSYNTPYLVVLVPSKSVLDTEFLPWYVQGYANSGRQTTEEAVLSRMAAASAGSVLFPLEECRRQNMVQKLYPPLNNHWVEGRYTAIMAGLIAERLGLAHYEPPAPESFTTSIVLSDITRRELPGIENYAWKRKQAASSSIKNKSLTGMYPSVPYPGRVSKYYVNEANSGRGRVLLIGDSFTRAIGQDLAAYFNELVVVTWMNSSKDYSSSRSLIEGLLREFKPDHVVFMSIRSSYAINQVKHLPDISSHSTP